MPEEEFLTLNDTWSPDYVVGKQDFKQIVQILNYLLHLTKYFFYTKAEFAKVEYTETDAEIYSIISTTSQQLGPLEPSVLRHLLLLLTEKKFNDFSFEKDEDIKKHYLPNILYYYCNYLKLPEVLLSIGGDDRQTIASESKLQKYHSTTFPRKSIIRRGSCTCSTVTEEVYSSSWKHYLHFTQKFLEVVFLHTAEKKTLSQAIADYYDYANQNGIIDRLKSILELNQPSLQVNDAQALISSPQIVLFPSGSDAEFLPLIVGLTRSYRLSKLHNFPQSKPSTDVDLKLIYSSIKVYNYVIAAGEVGSGTPQGATGQHFSPLAPRGVKQVAGNYLSGIHANMIETISFKPRDSLGHVSFQEKDLIDHISAKLSSSSTSVALVHLVCGSKTGLIYPSQESLDYLRQQYGSDRVIVIADTCQLRNRLTVLNEYLAKNYLILFTASKFYTAPPFCGGVLLPARLANELEHYLAEHSSLSVRKEESLLPAGLVDYITQYEVSKEMKHLRHYLDYFNRALAVPPPPSSTSEEVEVVGGWFNYSLNLRWNLGLDVMERYHALPTALVREFTRLWINTVTSFVQRHSPFIQLLQDQANDVTISYSENFESLNSILPFSLFTRHSHSGEGFALRELTADEHKDFHKLLTVPVEGVEGVEVMLGQPVKLSDVSGKSVLRIALGADIVVRALYRSKQGQWFEADVNRAVKALRRAFSAATTALLSDAFITTGQVEVRGAETNPWLTSVLKILKEDYRTVKKIYQLSLHWGEKKATSVVPLITGSRALPEIASESYLLAKRKKIDELDSDFAVQSFPLPQRPSNASSIFDAKAVPDVLHAIRKINGKLPASFLLYDLDAVAASFQSVKKSFHCSDVTTAAVNFLHCFAVKSCPLTYILHLAVEAGLGLECASLNEVKQSLACGASPSNIVYDSPCKTSEDLSFALRHGIRINANSFHEVGKIAALLEDGEEISEGENKRMIGLRINPLVGDGTNKATSTANEESKFGIPLFSTVTASDFPTLSATASEVEEEAVFRQLEELLKKDDVFRAAVTCLLKHASFINGVMCHVGSQGMSLTSMVQGVERLYLVMKYVSWKLQGGNSHSTQHFLWLDIGGGLFTNYYSDDVTPAFSDYYKALETQLPQLFLAPPRTASSTPPLLVLTEFGKSIIAKTAFYVSKIEDIIAHPPSTTSVEGSVSCILHAGADVFLRTAYCGEKFSHHRLQLIDANYHYVTASADDSARDKVDPVLVETSEGVIVSERPVLVDRVHIVGPLCFSGDSLARNVSLPKPVFGDSVVLADAGANTISLFSRHCSRSSPAVFGFRHFPYEVHHPKLGVTSPSNQRTPVIVSRLREEESSEELMKFWD